MIRTAQVLPIVAIFIVAILAVVVLRKRWEVVMRSNEHMLFVASLLILTVASTSMTAANATAKVGRIILTPTHAPPGTLVSFEGEDWGLQPVPFLPCIAYGEPVKIDRYAKCEIGGSKGVSEPVGTFMVKDIPAGTYSVYVVIQPAPVPGEPVSQTTYTGWLIGEAKFVVDAKTPVSPVASLTSAMTTAATSTRIVPPTVTVTTMEPTTTPQAFDYTTMLAPLSIVAVATAIILAVILLRRRRSSQ